MANHKSALKRARQNEIRRMRNRMAKTVIKNATKALRQSVEEKSPEAAAKLIAAKSVIDKAAKKGTIHKRTAARKVSRLSKLVNTLSA